MVTSHDLSRVHLVGIGGAGMSGLASILLERGLVVSGSDIKESPALGDLRTLGAHIAVGHAADNLTLSGQLPTVVVTSFAAIPPDNPELSHANSLGIPVIRRSDLLGELMADKTQILIAGTHGKTSTTSMAVVAMHHADMDPSYAIGGQLSDSGKNAHHGLSQFFIAEADESDASLLRYSPDIAVVTNMEPDHLDYYGSNDAYMQVFYDFAERIDSGGTLIVCLDDPAAAQLGEDFKDFTVVWGYGTPEAAAQHPDIAHTIVESMSTGTDHTTAVLKMGERSMPISLSIPGQHMVLNAAAAVTAGVAAGGDFAALVRGISAFGGVRRRFEYRGSANDIDLYDDYAHHPTEVAAVLQAARERIAARGHGRLVAVFQPHLYSRTLEFSSEFASALSLADRAYVLDIYGAREEAVEGVDSQIITSAMTIPASFVSDFSAAAATIAPQLQPGDLVITMGAGSVTMLGASLFHELTTGA
ncbi:UDP-N-acetylmuramate--L-alanine ligase [Corynebacterium sp. ES2794-CONJ1]|uniref:UDP-N-acetylmuramate--L-alanine ligase n=1 Tax=Corynebacterium sp. ES2794-CONJ1 TaxID=2980553 RepID=UPI0021DA1C4B|nr:UDP-N-acetylmuramate--L-alanine ligase [Corynebacterium sp. ES2794-CONJ1]MCU9518657.1 UDP-N-acetylmuramate--L-alanine ligase [Corynebacterium sp. ES2794-CONJ1]